MPQSSRIPTPLKQHLHRFRVGLLPVMSFIFCVMFTVWLWQRQGMTGTVMGEIEGEVFDVVAGVDGELKVSGAENWQLFDVVKKGQPIAYLDDSLIQARMDTVRATAKQLEAELDSTTADFQQQQFDVVQQRHGDALRLYTEVERLNLELLQLYPTRVGLEAQQAALAEDLNRLKSFQQQQNLSLVPEMDYRELQREHDMVKAQLEATHAAMEKIKERRNQLEKKLEDFPEVPSTSVEALLAPIRREIEVQEKLLGEIQVELDNCVIRSPIDGVISTIWRRPGQRVGAADPIISVASTDNKYVLGYVRDQQRIPLYQGMEVGLRLGNQPYGPEYTSSVESISPQVAPLPLRRLADQNVMELATWIRIPIPEELQKQKLRPGQRVTVILRPSRSFE